MASTTFNGPVRSENGFASITKDPVTGAITITATFGPSTSITNLAASGVVLMTGLPTVDPEVVGQLWNNGGVVTVSAG